MTQPRDRLDAVEWLRSRSGELALDVVTSVGPTTGPTEATAQRVAAHIANLADAIAARHPATLRAHLAGLVRSPDKTASTGQVGCELQELRRSIAERLPDHAAALACEYVWACEDVVRTPTTASSGVAMDYDHIRLRYLEALLGDDDDRAHEVVADAVEDGATTTELFLQVLEPVQYEIGRRWESGEVSVAQEHFCTAVTETVVARSRPIGPGARIPADGRRALLACVEGELHAIGARMVADVLELHGWDVHHLGANCPTTEIVSTLARRPVDLVCLSFSVSAHAATAERAIRAVREMGDDRPLPILIGGRAVRVDPGIGHRLGADGSALDAASAVGAAAALVPT
ncbi:MAG: cobalamin-dependent protein [Actinomycetota bacterium]|nr:cobalamin-dependent protein [Actinomycetota bacterium]